MRKKRRYKFTSRERLFNFLTYCRHYPRLRKGSTDFGIGKTALLADVVWLREQLSVHPLMVAEVQWPTPDELEAERLCLVQAGLLSAGFEFSVFMCDGTKDLGRRNAHYGHKHDPDYSQKGNGKSHLLFTNLFGAPMMLAAGIQGCENDPAAYQMTHVYRDPERHLMPKHTGLFDGVFQSALHVNTEEPGTLPANAPELRARAPAARRRRLRVRVWLRSPHDAVLLAELNHPELDEVFVVRDLRAAVLERRLGPHAPLVQHRHLLLLLDLLLAPSLPPLSASSGWSRF